MARLHSSLSAATFQVKMVPWETFAPFLLLVDDDLDPDSVLCSISSALSVTWDPSTAGIFFQDRLFNTGNKHDMHYLCRYLEHTPSVVVANTCVGTHLPPALFPNLAFHCPVYGSWLSRKAILQDLACPELISSQACECSRHYHHSYQQIQTVPES